MEQNLNTESKEIKNDVIVEATIVSYDKSTGVGTVKPLDGPTVQIPPNLIKDFGVNNFTVGKKIKCKSLGPGTHAIWLGI